MEEKLRGADYNPFPPFIHPDNPDLRWDDVTECYLNSDQRKKLSEIFESTKPKTSDGSKIIGQIIMFGTGGSFNNKSFKDTFYGKRKD